jgi:hypothetical protein
MQTTVRILQNFIGHFVLLISFIVYIYICMAEDIECRSCISSAVSFYNKLLGRPGRRWNKILKLIIREWCEVFEWIEVARNKDQWWARIKTVINPGVSKQVGNLTLLSTISFSVYVTSNGLRSGAT